MGRQQRVEPVQQRFDPHTLPCGATEGWEQAALPHHFPHSGDESRLIVAVFQVNFQQPFVAFGERFGGGSQAAGEVDAVL